MTRSASAIAINLSFVLHERSDSPIVARYAADIERQRRGRERDVAKLQQLSADQLRRRIVVETTAPRLDQSSLRILSVEVGAWRILEPLLMATFPALDQASVSTCFVDGGGEQRATRTLFRAPARVCLPDEGDRTESGIYFAAAIVRPGGETVQLRLEPLPQDSLSQADQSAWERAGTSIEKTWREFVLQWDCGRSLWSRPVEQTLPEFTRASSGCEDA